MQIIFSAQPPHKPHVTPNFSLCKLKNRHYALDEMPKFDIHGLWNCVSFSEEGKAVEELLTAGETARRLGVSRQTFWRLRGRLRARGLRVVMIPSTRPGGRPAVRYQASSLHRLIDRAAQREAAIC